MYKCLVTGHKGFIGSKIFNKLQSLNYYVKGIDLKDGENILDNLPNEDFDIVFHLAAIPRVQYSYENPSETLKNNVLGTSSLLEWAVNHKVKRLIFSSSSAVYGNHGTPVNPYGLQKKMSEEECKLYSEIYGIDTVCLRYFNVFSNDQEYIDTYSTLICSWKEMIKKNMPLNISGDGTQERDFIHVDDIVSANIFCMNYKDKFNGEYFDVGTGISVSLNNIKFIVDKYNKVTWKFIDSRKSEVDKTLADVSKLNKLGWNHSINPLVAIEDCFRK